MSDKDIIVVDSQRLNMIQNCAYKYDLTFNRDLVPLEKAEPLERGSLIHAMMQTYYRMRMHRSRWTRNKHGKQEIYKVCVRVAEHFAHELSLSIEEVDLTIRIFKEYIDFYWDEPHETLAVEQVGTKVMHEDEDFILVYETKIDWIFRLHGHVMPCDHKHSKRRGTVAQLSNQFLGYCWMLDVRNIMVNKIGFQSTLTPKEKFERPVLSYPKSVIDAWVQNTIWWAKMIRFHSKNNTWPQNLTSCDKYSGCIFQEVCITTPEARTHKIAQLFEKTEETWDVGQTL
jgi:hypothetical protein